MMMSKEENRARKKCRRIRRLSEKIYYLSTFIWRKVLTKCEWDDEKAGNYQCRSLSPEEKAEVRRVWGNVKVKDKWFVMYNSIKRDGDVPFDARYMPLDIYYCFIDEWFNNTRESYTMDDKNMYDLYFNDVRRPQTVVRRINGRLLDERYRDLTIEQAVQLCKSQKSVIKKPTLYAAGGAGIDFWDEADGMEALVNILEKGGNFVVQGIVRQHPDLAALHEESLNTIRIVTCYLDGKVEVLSSLVRVGVGSARIDNACSGGVFCGLEDDGRLKKYAYNMHIEAFERHPNGILFAEHKIPYFDRCKELALSLANRFLRVAKLISWDMAIGEDGEPVLIEMNLTYGGADMPQIANGPLFGDKTEQVVRQALNTKRYRRYKRWL
ncbi:MAG: hypothetical protein IKG81_08740 [Bacteroidales bacterium]|nr:hypothetical protein [Bacteroidales bacterium]